MTNAYDDNVLFVYKRVFHCLAPGSRDLWQMSVGRVVKPRIWGRHDIAFHKIMNISRNVIYFFQNIAYVNGFVLNNFFIGI